MREPREHEARGEREPGGDASPPTAQPTSSRPRTALAWRPPRGEAASRTEQGRRRAPRGPASPTASRRARERRGPTRRPRARAPARDCARAGCEPPRSRRGRGSRRRGRSRRHPSATGGRSRGCADRSAPRSCVALKVRDEEVVGPDSCDRMALELDQPDPPEVVPVAAEPAEVRRARRLLPVLEAVPGRARRAATAWRLTVKPTRTRTAVATSATAMRRVVRREGRHRRSTRAKPQPATPTTTADTSTRSIARLRACGTPAGSARKTSSTGWITGAVPHATKAKVAIDRSLPGTRIR